MYVYRHHIFKFHSCLLLTTSPFFDNSSNPSTPTPPTAPLSPASHQTLPHSSIRSSLPNRSPRPSLYPPLPSTTPQPSLLFSVVILIRWNSISPLRSAPGMPSQLSTQAQACASQVHQAANRDGNDSRERTKTKTKTSFSTYPSILPSIHPFIHSFVHSSFRWLFCHLSSRYPVDLLRPGPLVNTSASLIPTGSLSKTPLYFLSTF